MSGENIRVPRHAIGSKTMYIELHAFTDASLTVYGACFYIRTINSDNTILVRLLMSKAKVAPFKPISVPPLELCGALLGARLFDKIHNALHTVFNKIVYRTDSTIVLGWLKMAPNPLKPFLQNRLTETQDLTHYYPWY